MWKQVECFVKLSELNMYFAQDRKAINDMLDLVQQDRQMDNI